MPEKEVGLQAMSETLPYPREKAIIRAICTIEALCKSRSGNCGYAKERWELRVVVGEVFKL